MRRAGPDEAAGIAACLQAKADLSMFPLANLGNHGMAGGHPRAMRFWVTGDPPDNVLGVTEEGMVMPQIAPDLAPEAARVMAGLSIIGLAGEAAQVRALIGACGLGAAPVRLDADEPHFTLSLDRLMMPDCAGLRLIPVGQADRDLVVGWRADYGVEVLGSAAEEARDEAVRDVSGWIAADSHRVLMEGDRPVALTGFNARLPGIVQVGGVWTPPALRRRGLARRAVALHLAEARDGGATRATLFSASDHAARAYAAIGFRPVGRFTLCLFCNPEEVRPV